MVILQPEGFRAWTVTAVNVATDQAPTATPVPRVKVYRGLVGGQVLAQTWQGNSATAAGTTYVQPSSHSRSSGRAAFLVPGPRCGSTEPCRRDKRPINGDQRWDCSFRMKW